jgi:hypothetical protein
VGQLVRGLLYLVVKIDANSWSINMTGMGDCLLLNTDI